MISIFFSRYTGNNNITIRYYTTTSDMNSNTTHNIYTSRFNNETWKENILYREQKGITGCIYGCPQRLNQKIPVNKALFICEMNNDTNKVEGIGIIRNRILCDKYYKVYDTGNYNRYVFKGQYHINREIFERYNPTIIKILDHILFKEKTHLKRGAGITKIPDKLMRHDICEGHLIQQEIHQVFKTHFHENIMEGEEDIKI